jgi:hypothetical protein
MPIKRIRLTAQQCDLVCVQDAVEELLTKQRGDIKLLREAEAKVPLNTLALQLQFTKSYCEGCPSRAGGRVA